MALTITKVATTATRHAGEPFTYTVVVTNVGPAVATGAQLVDTFTNPAQVTATKYQVLPAGAQTSFTSPGTISLPDPLAVGATVTILIIGTVAAGLTAPATIENTGTAGATGVPAVTDRATIILDPSADMSVTKIANPSPVKTGGTLTYTINVKNNGLDQATGVKLTDVPSTNLTNPQYSTDGGTTWNPWTGILDIGTMVGGTTTSVQIRGTVAVTTDASLINTASISAITYDPVPANNQSTITTTITKVADVAIVKTANPSPVKTGEILTYTIKVTNNGPNEATGVKVTDTVPTNLTNPQYSTDNGLTWNTWTGTVGLANIANGVTTTLLIRGTVAATAATTMVNTATVAAEPEDPTPGNNTSTATTTITKVAAVVVTKTASPSPVKTGDTLTYTIKVTNNGPDVANGVSLTDTIPMSLSTPEYSIDSGATWKTWMGTLDLGTMASGVTTTVLIRGKVDSTTDLTIVNTASVKSLDPASSNQSTATTTIIKVADVAVTKATQGTCVRDGEHLIYAIIVTNNGPDAAGGVVLIDAVPSELINVDYSLDGGMTWAQWTGSLTIGTLAKDQKKTVLIRGKVHAKCAKVVTNTAKVTSDQAIAIDPNLQNNTATVSVHVEHHRPWCDCCCDYDDDCCCHCGRKHYYDDERRYDYDNDDERW